MITRRVVIFSGFDTKFVEQTKAQLKANQAEVIFAQTASGLDADYFEQLLTRTLALTDRLVEKSDTRVVALVASCIADTVALDLERRAFFPAFRRADFPSSFAKDLNRVNEVVHTLVTRFAS